jgi:hypothetical protein
MNTQILITCDAESLVFPQNIEIARKNIFGVIGESNRRTGIELIMDIADSNNSKVLFFYDVFTEYSVPGINNEVFDYVLKRGHLIELHAHVEHLSEKWWLERGFKKPTWATNYYDLHTAELVYSDAIALFKKSSGFTPSAFRAGSWRYCSNILEYLYSNKVKYSFNYYPLTTIRESYPHGLDAGPLNIFKWSNGMYEIPTSTLTVPNLLSNRKKYFGFENHLLNSDLMYKNFMHSYLDQNKNADFMVLVMHSWSLSNRENNCIKSEDKYLMNSFKNFLQNKNKNNYEFLNSDIFSEISKKEISMTVPIEFAGFSNSFLLKI